MGVCLGAAFAHGGSWRGIFVRSLSLPWDITLRCGVFGGLLYAVMAYSGFFFAPAAHGSVLMPGTLALWASLLAIPLLGERLHRNRLVGLACITGGGNAGRW
jgi:drug/metabolite transporter (DMT)-like permease